jgi:UDP-N-acetylmuramoylalanine-D-glutamate ligase
VKILMLSWEYPPVVIGGLGRHVHHLATALAEAGHEVVVLSRRQSGTDPSTHPSTDEIAEGVRVVAAAQDPHEFWPNTSTSPSSPPSTPPRRVGIRGGSRERSADRCTPSSRGWYTNLTY